MAKARKVADFPELKQKKDKAAKKQAQARARVPSKTFEELTESEKEGIFKTLAVRAGLVVDSDDA
jgi:hypothetical protein